MGNWCRWLTHREGRFMQIPAWCARNLPSRKYLARRPFLPFFFPSTCYQKPINNLFFLLFPWQKKKYLEILSLRYSIIVQVRGGRQPLVSATMMERTDRRNERERNMWALVFHFLSLARLHQALIQLTSILMAISFNWGGGVESRTKLAAFSLFFFFLSRSVGMMRGRQGRRRSRSTPAFHRVQMLLTQRFDEKAAGGFRHFAAGAPFIRKHKNFLFTEGYGKKRATSFAAQTWWMWFLQPPPPPPLPSALEPKE